MLALITCIAFVSCSKAELEPESEPEPDPQPDTTVIETPVTSMATEVLNLTPEFFTLSGVSKDSVYEAGSTLSLTLLPGETLMNGFEQTHMEHIHIHVNDDVYFPVMNAESPASSVQVDIAIPEDDFEIIACYSVQQQMSESGYTMYLEENDAVRLYGVSHEERYRYFDCYLLTEDAYTITGIQFKVGDGEWRNVQDVAGCSYTRSGTVENVYSIAVRPDYQDVTGDVTLRVEGEQHGRYSITWENANATYLDMEKSILPEESIDGETVTAELWVNGEYYLNTAEASVSGLELDIISRAYVRFVMPASDVTITLDILEKIPVSYTESQNITYAEFYDANDIYYGVPTGIGIPGEPVWLFATAAEGYKPMKAVTDNGETFSFGYYAPGMYRSEIVIPAGAESMSASIETSVAYNVSIAEGLEVVLSEGYLYAEGETVSMTAYVPQGQKIKEVVVTDAYGQTLPVTVDSPYASFIMPASDVTVSVFYEDINADQSVSVIAYFDPDVYDVSSSTNFDWDFAESFTVTQGSTFHFSVYNWYGDFFYVGVRIGEQVTIYPADFDDMMGEYSFGRSIVANGDVVIKVGATESEVSF